MADSNLIVDKVKKVVIYNEKKMTPMEEKLLGQYIQGGYEAIRKTKKATKENRTTEKAILKALETDPDALATFQEKKRTGNFFTARAWYFAEYLRGAAPEQEPEQAQPEPQPEKPKTARTTRAKKPEPAVVADTPSSDDTK